MVDPERNRGALPNPNQPFSITRTASINFSVSGRILAYFARNINPDTTGAAAQKTAELSPLEYFTVLGKMAGVQNKYTVIDYDTFLSLIPLPDPADAALTFRSLPNANDLQVAAGVFVNAHRADFPADIVTSIINTPTAIVHLGKKYTSAGAFERMLRSESTTKMLSEHPNSKNALFDNLCTIGRILYGAQWTYLEQIRLLEDDAFERFGTPDERAVNPGSRENSRYSIEGRATFSANNPIERFRDAGREVYIGFDGDLQVASRREIIIFDRSKDPQLAQWIAEAQYLAEKVKINSKNGQLYPDWQLRVVWEIGKMLTRDMLTNDPSIIQNGAIAPAIQQTLNQNEIHIGAFRRKDVKSAEGAEEAIGGAVCRHINPAIAYIAQFCGVTMDLVRGRLSNLTGDMRDANHVFDEVYMQPVVGKMIPRLRLFDASAPPQGRSFSNSRTFEVADFENSFPEIGTLAQHRSPNVFEKRYDDVDGNPLYIV